jgi:hypothetical protein
MAMSAKRVLLSLWFLIFMLFGTDATPQEALPSADINPEKSLQSEDEGEKEPDQTPLERDDSGNLLPTVSDGDVFEDDTPGLGEEFSNFKGFIKERGNRRPISDATIYLVGTDESAMSDQEGYFEFYNLPPGEYTIVIPNVNFEKYETTETITANEIVQVTYYLEPKAYGDLEVVVRGQKIKKEVSRSVIKIQEAQVIPGSQGDAVKVVETLPGVARGINNAGLVIRGSNAEDSRVTLDRHSIPQLFHFGGFKSVYNSDFLEQIDLYTGGFGADFGNATGGIVELKSRKVRSDRWGGYIDTSFIDATGLVEGPISDNVGFGFAFRRSTLDLILPPILAGNEDFDFVSLPVYYDYQFKLDWKIDKYHSLSFDWYGALDKLELLTSIVSDSNPEVTGQFGFRQMFHNGIIRYTYDNGIFKSVFSPGVAFVQLNFQAGPAFFFDLKAITLETYEDISLVLNKNHTLLLGTSLEPRWAQIKSNLILPPKEGDVDISFSNSEKVQSDVSAWDALIGFYLADEIRYGKVLIVPGVRFDYYSRQNSYAVGPRFKVRYQVIDKLALKIATGLYHRPPDPDESYEPYGNAGLTYERAVHLIAGLEWDITDVINLDVQGYYKYLDNLVNQVENAEPGGIVYANNAKGYVIGGEVLLRHNFTRNFFGWISYSITRAMRNDGPGTPYRLFDQDQTHNLTVVASYSFLKTWRIGGRFTFSSGEPYTDITGGILNSDNGTYLPIYDSDNKNEQRNKPYHRLDIRLDKDWVFNTWILTTYLDIQNVYYHSNPVSTAYNYDYSEQSDFVDLPIIPSIGIKAKF